MITLYTWTTGNSRKATIMMEEIGLPYDLRPVDIRRKEQLTAEYLKISPNHTVPAIVDHDAPGAPRAVFESGAVLIYLADKSGKFLATSGPRRDQALAWLFWASSTFSQAHTTWRHFATRAGEKIPVEIERLAKEAHRALTLLERRLSEEPYLAGDFSIADIAAFPRARNALPEFRKVHPDDLGPTPGIDRWLAAIEAVGCRFIRLAQHREHRRRSLRRRQTDKGQFSDLVRKPVEGIPNRAGWQLAVNLQV
jgi:GST-like protein